MRRVPIVIPVTIAACLSFSIPALAQQNDEGVQYNTIRTVLGAGRRELIGMVLKQGAFVTGIGVVIGLGGALLLTSFLEGLVFGITTHDVPTFLVVVLLVSVSLFASYVPARRVIRIDPVDALRQE